MSGKYLLTLRAPFTSNWRKSYHASCEAALEVAWRKYKREWSIDSITHEQNVVFTSDDLTQAFTQMDNLVAAQAKRPPLEVAEQVLKEMGRRDTESLEAEARV